MRRAYRARWGRILAVWVGLVAVVGAITLLLAGCDVAYCAEWKDLGVVHKTLIAEAGGERDRVTAMQAVGNVIRRRAELRGMTVEAVCLQRWQFSCWNGGAGRVDAFTRKNRAVWDDALTAWQLSGVEDITNGGDHYHTKAVNPKWNRGMEQTAVVGQHRFFKS